MKLYAGIDLHSNNSVLVIIDEADSMLSGSSAITLAWDGRRFL